MTPEDKIRKADDVFSGIFQEFRPFHSINPSNHLEERERFISAYESGKTYNPMYEYNSLPSGLPKWKKQLRALDVGITPMEEMVDDARAEWLRFLEMLETRATPALTAQSVGLYGEPGASLVAEASETLKNTPRQDDQSEDVGIKGLTAKLRERLRADRMEGWDVVEDTANIHLAQVDSRDHKIHLQAGMLVTGEMVDRLIHHEVEVHVYRAANGERQPLKLFAIGFDHHLETDEGLAVLLEDKMGLLGNNIRRRYAGRVIAAHLALKHGFFDIFSKLVEFFPLDEAYALTLRSKRGLRETSKPGGFVQDHIYLQGHRKLKGLSVEDLQLLFCGKISANHIPLVREMIEQHRLLEPAFVPPAFHG